MAPQTSSAKVAGRLAEWVAQAWSAVGARQSPRRRASEARNGGHLQSRLQVDGRLTAFLPPNVQADVSYGGLSGNPLTILLDDDLAISRESTLTFGPDFLSARILAVFDAGQVSGVLEPNLVEAD